ncbi:MAG: TRAM domain-containing protein, partial [Sulfolobales archaeon]
HIAQYSIRPFTESASMPQIKESVKKQRSSYLQKLQEEIGLSINKSFIGSRVKTLVVKKGYRDETLIGRSTSYRTVVLKKEDWVKPGVWVDVEISDVSFFDLRGKPLEPD